MRFSRDFRARRTERDGRVSFCLQASLFIPRVSARRTAWDLTAWAVRSAISVGKTTRSDETKRARTDQSFLVPKDEIAGNDYDLSINRYKEIVYEAVEYDPPQEILQRIAKIEEEIAQGRKELEGMLK